MKQFKVKVTNESGALSSVCEALAEKNVRIRAISTEAISSTDGFIKLITGNDVEAKLALDAAGFTYTESAVLVLDVIDSPENIAQLTNTISEAKINIKSFYLLDKGLFAMTVKREDFAKAKEALGDRVIESV
jgi:hypothetical protein